MSRPLDGKVAIVTGGGRGLGRSMARALGEAGCAVVVAARSRGDLDTFVEESGALGRPAMARPTDVTDESSVTGLVADTVERFGRLDIMVNNSGVIITRPIVEMSLDDWRAVVDTNLQGTFLCVREAGKQMIAQGEGGKIVNLASTFGLKGIPNHVAYSASKAGVIGLTRSTAIEWARFGIQVNALAPGYFVTDMNAAVRSDEELGQRVLKTIPLRRMAQAAELDSWIVALAGPASDFMTGEVIAIDGGQSVA